MLGIGGEFQQRLGGGLEQAVVDDSWVLQGQGCQFVGQREHHVKIRHRQQFACALREPSGPGHRLALRAVPVAARVVLNLLVAAVVAALEMATQGRRATTENGPQHLLLTTGEHSSVLPAEPFFPVAEDIGDFQGRVHEATPRASSAWSNSIVLGASRSSASERCVYKQVV